MENLDLYGDLAAVSAGNSNHYGTVSSAGHHGTSPAEVDYGSTSSLVQQVDDQMKSVINIGR